jgi:sugar/nucleoside kinase (ribokinase family)
MMSDRFDVAGIGNAIVDVIFPASDEFLLEHGIAKSVMTLIDEFRAEQLIELAEDSKQISGGSAANTMAGLASFGAKGKFIGKVKNDRLGQRFVEDMKNAGVHFDTPMAETSLPTACSLIAVTPDGHRSMSTYLGACRELTPDDIDPSEIGAVEFLYIEGYLWDEEGPKEAIRKAIAASKGAGRSVAFTLSDPFCVGRYRDEFLHLMKSDIDILFANEEEAKALFEVDTFNAALKAAKAWHGISALTRSENGCVIVGGNDELHVLPAERVTQVVDTTGAGDQFAAGFLYGLSRKRDLRTAGRMGAVAAAEVISHYGARPEQSLKAKARHAKLL